MSISLAPPLIAGLGLRVLFQTVSPSPDPTLLDPIVSGTFQGMLVYHAFLKYPPEVPVLVSGAIAVKLVYDVFVLFEDVTKNVSVVLGIALGVLLLDIISRYQEEAELPGPTAGRSTTRPRKERAVQFRSTTHDDRGRRHEHDEDEYEYDDPTTTRRAHRRVRRMESHENSIITAPSLDISLPSVSEVTDSTRRAVHMSPLEREVAELRTRASLADTERRRFREEKKWAESQGNRARAEQMKWQVKRYTALMESFNREADAKVVAGSKGRARDGLNGHEGTIANSAPVYMIPPRPLPTGQPYDWTGQNGHGSQGSNEPIYVLPPRPIPSTKGKEREIPRSDESPSANGSASNAHQIYILPPR